MKRRKKKSKSWKDSEAGKLRAWVLEEEQEEQNVGLLLLRYFFFWGRIFLLQRWNFSFFYATKQTEKEKPVGICRENWVFFWGII